MNIHLTLSGLLTGIVLLGAAGEIVRRSVRFVYRASVRFNEIYDVIVNELLPNGGGSMRDKLHSIDDRLKDVEAAVLDRRASDSA